MQLARCLLFAIALAAIAPGARAADPAAESLFREAVELMKNGEFAAACPKLEASLEIEPKSGTSITLGSCQERLGKTATAWALYKDAAAMARSEGRDDYVAKAGELAEAIEPKVSRLKIEPPMGEVAVTLDGERVHAGAFGVPFALDPGNHELQASAPGRKPWATTIEILADGSTQSVTIPELELQPPPAEPVAAPVSQPPPVPVYTPRSPPPFVPPLATDVPGWAWVIGAVGVVAAGVGISFAIDQRLASDALDDHCGGPPRNLCPPDYDFDGDHAREQRDFGLFLGFGIGGVVLIGASIVGIATAASSADVTSGITPRLGPDGIGFAF